MERGQPDTTGTNTVIRFNNSRPTALHLMVDEAVNVYFGDYPEADLTAMAPDVIMDGLVPVRFDSISVRALTINVPDALFSALKY